MSGPDIVAFLRAWLDEDEAWALGASSSYGRAATDGEHWRWEDTGTDEEVKPDPALQGEYMGGENNLGLRSIELYPYRSIPGGGPHMVLSHVQEVQPAVAGHIARHDPARVLREVEAKRRMLDELAPLIGFEPREDYSNPENIDAEIASERAERILRGWAAVHDQHPDYDPAWRPS